jgi:hypothetical protein
VRHKKGDSAPSKKTLDDKIYEARHAQVLAREAKEPLRWFYLSFADNGFLGATVVRAHGVVSASKEAFEHGCNPGGDVLAIAMEDGDPVPDEIRYRLIRDPDELQRIFAKTGGVGRLP